MKTMFLPGFSLCLAFTAVFRIRQRSDATAIRFSIFCIVHVGGDGRNAINQGYIAAGGGGMWNIGNNTFAIPAAQFGHGSVEITFLRGKLIVFWAKSFGKSRFLDFRPSSRQ